MEQCSAAGSEHTVALHRAIGSSSNSCNMPKKLKCNNRKSLTIFFHHKSAKRSVHHSRFFSCEMVPCEFNYTVVIKSLAKRLIIIKQVSIQILASHHHFWARYGLKLAYVFLKTVNSIYAQYLLMKMSSINLKGKNNRHTMNTSLRSIRK